VGKSASAFKRAYLYQGRECVMEAFINNQSKSLYDKAENMNESVKGSSFFFCLT
jgi:hypothetical protein